VNERMDGRTDGRTNGQYVNARESERAKAHGLHSARAEGTNSSDLHPDGRDRSPSLLPSLSSLVLRSSVARRPSFVVRPSGARLPRSASGLHAQQLAAAAAAAAASPTSLQHHRQTHPVRSALRDAAVIGPDTHLLQGQSIGSRTPAREDGRRGTRMYVLALAHAHRQPGRHTHTNTYILERNNASTRRERRTHLS